MIKYNVFHIEFDVDDEFGDDWEVENIVPLDQFPNTNHCEIIVKMKNKIF